MPGPSQTVSALRSLLAARFPEKTRRPCGSVPAAVRPIDDALGGGLPAGRLTELVSLAPSSGGQTVLAGLLAATQAARQRIALVDGSDGFASRRIFGQAIHARFAAIGGVELELPARGPMRQPPSFS